MCVCVKRINLSGYTLPADVVKYVISVCVCVCVCVCVNQGHLIKLKVKLLKRSTSDYLYSFETCLI